MQIENTRLFLRMLAGGMSFSLILFTFIFFCSLAHAIGPYTTGSKTIVDKGTGLEWQRSDDATLYSWEDALGYCENISLDGKIDWRLPNIRELKSILDYSRYYPAVDSAIPCRSSTYWSSTTVADDTHLSAWSIFFGNGDDIWKLKSDSFHVRCVRGGFTAQ